MHKIAKTWLMTESVRQVMEEIDPINTETTLYR